MVPRRATGCSIRVDRADQLLRSMNHAPIAPTSSARSRRPCPWASQVRVHCCRAPLFVRKLKTRASHRLSTFEQVQVRAPASRSALEHAPDAQGQDDGEPSWPRSRESTSAPFHGPMAPVSNPARSPAFVLATAALRVRPWRAASPSNSPIRFSRERSGRAAHPAVQGSTTSMPMSTKSRTLRVATVMPRERAIAAIWQSAGWVGRPAERRLAAISA